MCLYPCLRHVYACNFYFCRYVTHVLQPTLTSKSLLLIDAWGGQQADDCFESIERETGFTCTRLGIPPGATATTQPLDVFYNRQWKRVVRQFYDHVACQTLNINLYSRDNIIKMQSLVHHMFTHETFVPMGQYAFYASGLRPDRSPYFQTPAEVLFPPALASCSNCPSKAFIRCVFCGVDLCFQEFFVLNHNRFAVVPGALDSMDWLWA